MIRRPPLSTLTDTRCPYTAMVRSLIVDTAIRLFVVADIPAWLANKAVAGVTLRATAREGVGIGVQGTAITETTGANTAGKDTVFADITVGVAGDAAREDRKSTRLNSSH